MSQKPRRAIRLVDEKIAWSKVLCVPRILAIGDNLSRSLNVLRVALTSQETILDRSKDICRLSTNGPNGWPHCIPVGYVFQHGKFYIPSALHPRKVRNLEKNGKATLVIDNEDTEHGIMVECNAKILSGSAARPYLNYMREVKK